MAGGDAKSDLLWLLGMLAILFAAWFATGGFNHPSGSAGPFLDPPRGNEVSEFRGGEPGAYTLDSAAAPERGQIRLDKGTASWASLASEEYILIRNRGEEPVVISGWSLRNSAGKWVVIPNGILVYRPEGSLNLSPIVLGAGEEAVVTTGRSPRVGPYQIPGSFKTNVCVGYLNDYPTANFKPSLPTLCPKPEEEPGYESLSEECADFVDRLSRCETVNLSREEERELSATCRRFLTARYNYAGCVAQHESRPDFLGRSWRVYLNQAGELWRKSVETIALYDSRGRLIDRLSY